MAICESINESFRLFSSVSSFRSSRFLDYSFQSVRLCDPNDGHLLLDGGYVNNLPGKICSR